MVDSETPRKIIVGIDFGTTYSGVAWAETQRPDCRPAITVWPISEDNLEGESSDKVPTKLRYTQQGTQWGFSIPMNAPPQEVAEWFKLDLDIQATAKSNHACGSTGQKLARGDKDAVTLSADFLSELGDHLTYTLKEKLGAAAVATTPLEFVVTVPAMWSDRARFLTYQACEKAKGLSTTGAAIHLVSEPEAAAHYALNGLKHKLKIGDSFVVCDAGGGTVDLITYTATGVDPVTLAEAVPGTGSVCGSAMLNRRFAKYLQDKLGKKTGFDDEALAEALEKFEKTIKRQFTVKAAPENTYSIPMGGLHPNKALGISRGRFAIKASDLHSIFKPVVEEVIQLVKQQISASPVAVKNVLLVGGFGASNYLKESLRLSLGKDIEVLQPPNAWLAVVQGAVMKGLAQSFSSFNDYVKVEERRARKHYGIEWSASYSDLLHGDLRHLRFWDAHGGCFRIMVMNWFLERGEPVSEEKACKFNVLWNHLVSKGRPGKHQITIFADFEDYDAPIRRNGKVIDLCTVEADLSDIPETEFTIKTGSDRLKYYQIMMEVEVRYLSVSTEYTLIHKGKRYETVKAEYV